MNLWQSKPSATTEGPGTVVPVPSVVPDGPLITDRPSSSQRKLDSGFDHKVLRCATNQPYSECNMTGSAYLGRSRAGLHFCGGTVDYIG
jgi:hypothetical protein